MAGVRPDPDTMNIAPLIVTRGIPADLVERLVRQGVHPFLAPLYAARGIDDARQLGRELSQLAAPSRMRNLEEMARLLARSILERKKLLIIADYDADGATACAVGLRALRAMGACVDYLVPDRFVHGYGLTPEIVRLAAETRHPDILITVDNGIASTEGVAEANRLGLKVLITDHHLPGPQLPDAWCIINPNQPGCEFPSKHLAGVGVMFYLMVALRAELRTRGLDTPNLAELLPLVALGTVADLVKLDDNNRLLVFHGLQRIRSGRAQPGLDALFRVAGRDPARAGVYDLGFVLGPRLNAAGRLADMSLGIECLVTDDAARALAIAGELDRLNRERRALETEMQEAALAALEQVNVQDGYSLCLYQPDWHSGVVGLVASRIKDRYHRPALVFARGANGELKGSGRSIPGLHLRDALDRVAKTHPDLILRFGGHAAAAGLTIRECDFERFSRAFESTVQSLVTPADLEREIETDGELNANEITLEHARLLEAEVWGQGFPEPRFCNRFDVLDQRPVGERHLRLRLGLHGQAFEGILFGSTVGLPASARIVYRLGVNEFNGCRSVQLVIEHWAPA
jgi:single-stranded-DNA-specific exonuclease